jgi:hypothetical protein
MSSAERGNSHPAGSRAAPACGRGTCGPYGFMPGRARAGGQSVRGRRRRPGVDHTPRSRRAAGASSARAGARVCPRAPAPERPRGREAPLVARPLRRSCARRRRIERDPTGDDALWNGKRYADGSLWGPETTGRNLRNPANRGGAARCAGPPCQTSPERRVQRRVSTLASRGSGTSWRTACS